MMKVVSTDAFELRRYTMALEPYLKGRARARGRNPNP